MPSTGQRRFHTLLKEWGSVKNQENTPLKMHLEPPEQPADKHKSQYKSIKLLL